MMYLINIVLFISFGIFQLCQGSAVIEIRLVSFNSSGLLTSKVCCDTQKPGPCPPNQCDPIFFVCIQDLSGNGCHLGNVTTGYTPNTDVILFSDAIGHTKTSNPCVFHVQDYPGIVIAKVTVSDEDILDGAQTNDKMDYLQYVYSFAPDKNGTTHKASKIQLSGTVSTLEEEMSVRCDENYYGTRCDVRCVPDVLFFCDANGQLTCRQGKTCTSISAGPSTSSVTSRSSIQMQTTISSSTVVAKSTTVPKTSAVSTSISSTASGVPTSTVLPLAISVSTTLTDTEGPTSTDNVSTTQSISTVQSSTPSVAMSTASTTASAIGLSNITDISSSFVTSSTLKGLATTEGSSSRSCSYNISDNDYDNFTVHIEEYDTDLRSFLEGHVISHMSKSNEEADFSVHEQVEEDGITYTITMVSKDGGLTLNTSFLNDILEDFCIQVMARSDYRISKGDKSDSVKVLVPVVIIGLLALLAIPVVYFICRRKCKKRQIGTEERKNTINHLEQTTTS